MFFLLQWSNSRSVQRRDEKSKRIFLAIETASSMKKKAHLPEAVHQKIIRRILMPGKYL